MQAETYCEDCDNRIPHKWPSRDMCIEHKREEGFGFVRRNTWDNAPPYAYCKDVNYGHCPLFKPRKETSNGTQS